LFSGEEQVYRSTLAANPALPVAPYFQWFTRKNGGEVDCAAGQSRFSSQCLEYFPARVWAVAGTGLTYDSNHARWCVAALYLAGFIAKLIPSSP